MPLESVIFRELFPEDQMMTLETKEESVFGYKVVNLSDVRFRSKAVIKSARNQDSKGPESAHSGHRKPRHEGGEFLCYETPLLVTGDVAGFAIRPENFHWGCERKDGRPDARYHRLS